MPAKMMVKASVSAFTPVSQLPFSTFVSVSVTVTASVSVIAFALAPSPGPGPSSVSATATKHWIDESRQ